MMLVGLAFWNRHSKRRAANTAQTAPDYIQKVNKKLNDKLLNKKARDIAERKKQEIDERLKKSEGRRSKGGRRPTAVMFDFFVGGGAGDPEAPPSNSLPDKPRKRRSSILNRPSLVKKDKKTKLPRRGRRGSRDTARAEGGGGGGGAEEADEELFEEMETEKKPKSSRPSSVLKGRESNASSTSTATKKATAKVKPTRTLPPIKGKENPKKIRPSFSEISDVPDDSGGNAEANVFSGLQGEEEKEQKKSSKNSSRKSKVASAKYAAP